MKRLVLFLSVLALPLVTAHAAPLPPPAPGHYKAWNGQIDDLEVVQPFHLKDYSAIEVTPPGVGAIVLPTDNTHDAVRKTLTDATRIVADEVDSSLPNRMKIKGEPLLAGMTAPAGSLVLHLKFVSLDPGSRSKRGLTFGNNGKASLVLVGDLTDNATNKPLLRFTVRNTDGSHGDYEHVLQENLEHAVDRVMRVVKTFYP